MIQIVNLCDKLKNKLDGYKKDKKIVDFRIVLRHNEDLQIYLIGHDEKIADIIEDECRNLYDNTDVDFFPADSNDIYPSVFENPSVNNILLDNGRRRLSSLTRDHDNDIDCPIITFYSYKGGQGRSTTLAAFASYMARQENKRVFIIDCDIEAPGFTNFFLSSPEDIVNGDGFIEYLIDKSVGLVHANQLSRYVREIDAKFSGGGIINVMPAGNLDFSVKTNDFLNDHLSHYIEGLARIDLNNYDYAVSILKGLLDDIIKEYSPDMILIDSRTGFNDIMGLFTQSLSNIVVGFFRGDSQSLPGLKYFISNLAIKDNIQIFLVNSILPAPRKAAKSLFNSFKQVVDEITDRELSRHSSDKKYDEISELFGRIKSFPISRREELELIGTSDGDSDDFLSLAAGDEYPEYDRLFSALSNAIDSVNLEDRTILETSPEIETKESSDIPQVSTINVINLVEGQSCFSDINKATTEEKDFSARQWHNDILNSASETLGNIEFYADQVDVEQKYNEGRFFLRECMKDLFNLDKYLIMGSKGTGKSYLYRALQSPRLVDIIKEYARKSGDYRFLDAVNRNSCILRVKKFGKRSSLFKQNFWMVYSWMIIAHAIKEIAPGFKQNPELTVFDIRDDNATLDKFRKLLDDKKKILLVEEEYHRLDEYFLENEKQGNRTILTVLYDQLDEIVEPEQWSEWIPELMEVWRFKRFNRIFGKLFLRRDLFRKMRGLTNINDIENQSINIEWKREEVYSFFFKTVLTADIVDKFWGLWYIKNPDDQQRLKELRKHYREEENKFKLDDYYLNPLVSTFFGKIVRTDTIKNLGESYYWLYDNLKNADDTISLRPFIDLIAESITEWKTDRDREKIEKLTPDAILSPYYYTNKRIRKSSVSRHIDDFVKEIGNKPIEYVLNFFTNANAKFKYLRLPKRTFEEAIKLTLKDTNDKTIGAMTTEALTDLMVANGIISKETNRYGDFYKFAHLYQYRLGLRSGMARDLSAPNQYSKKPKRR